MKCAGKLVEEEAQGFGEALVDLKRCRDARKEVVLRGEVAAAVSQEGQGGAAGESAADETDPGDDAHPADFAFDGGEQNENERERSGERDGCAEAPAHAGDPADEKIREPDRDGQRADVHEKAERQEIASDRKMPGTFAKEAFERNI